jgi:hypothetical protein
LPNGLLFGGGGAAVKQLGIEVLGIGVAVVAVFVLSHLTVRVLAALMGGITTGYMEGDPVETATGASAQLE